MGDGRSEMSWGVINEVMGSDGRIWDVIMSSEVANLGAFLSLVKMMKMMK